MNRRNFIQNTVLTSALAATNPIELFAENETKITILHTNDVHSHIEPFPSDHPRNANMGGVAKRAKLIQQIKAENPNVLLLDAGDSFQGTPYFNYFEGELEWKLMSQMGYHATTIGNHEFDNGLTGILKPLEFAKFDLLSANYDFSNTILEGRIKPYKIYQIAGIKIGVFGLGVELQGLVDKRMYLETKYLDPVEISTDMVRILKDKHQCDVIICLSHLGFDYRNEPNKISDKKLAQLTNGIDVIIGGHTHTFLEKPFVLKNKMDKEVMINQVGAYGIYLGRIDLTFQKNKGVQTNTRVLQVG
ncbi:MAG: metallophosphatase [Flavobacteriales bacterium]|nr:metallophosphatase [Flavobacteriales bacterium]